MITITINKEEVRRAGEYESNRYKVELVREVENPDKLKETINETWDAIRASIRGQKELDKDG